VPRGVDYAAADTELQENNETGGGRQKREDRRRRVEMMVRIKRVCLTLEETRFRNAFSERTLRYLGNVWDRSKTIDNVFDLTYYSFRHLKRRLNRLIPTRFRLTLKGGATLMVSQSTKEDDL
jgi:hypothetical protein